MRGSDREWTIVRPGALTDEPGTGRVSISTDPFRGKVSREDVAAVLAAVLGEHPSIGKILYLNGGDRLSAGGRDHHAVVERHLDGHVA